MGVELVIEPLRKSLKIDGELFPKTALASWEMRIYLSCAFWCCGCWQQAGWRPWLWPMLNGTELLRAGAGCCTTPWVRECCQPESPSQPSQLGHRKICQNKWRRQTSQRGCQRSPAPNLWGNQTESLVQKDCTAKDKQKNRKLGWNKFASRYGRYPKSFLPCIYVDMHTVPWRFASITPVI